MTTADIHPEQLAADVFDVAKAVVLAGVNEGFAPLTDRISAFTARIAAFEHKGDVGAAGKDGADGARGPKGDRGPEGERGPAPQHEWDGTALRFREPDGSWGELVDLKGPKGTAGKDGRNGGGGVNFDALTVGDGSTPTFVMVRQASGWVQVPWSVFLTFVSGSSAPANALMLDGQPLFLDGAALSLA